MNWLKRLFAKRERGYRPYTLYDFFCEYKDAEHEIRSLKQFIRESNRNSEYWSCEMIRLQASKDIRFRYSLQKNHVGFAWYLLEEFYKGNITIKKDVQPIAGREIHT